MKSVLPDTRIWTDNGVFEAHQLITLADKTPFHVYDGFGNKSRITVKDGGEENIHGVYLDTGQMVPFGESHTIYSIVQGDVKPQHRPISKFKKGETFYTHMPSRKLWLSPGSLTAAESPPGAIFNFMAEKDRLSILMDTYNSFEGDEAPVKFKSNVYVKPPTLEAFKEWSQVLGFYGIAVIGHASHNMLEIDPKRPSCFATKLFIGRGSDPANLLNDLIDSHIVTPVLPFDKMVKMGQDVGIVCEGELTEHLRLASYALNTEKSHPVCHVTIDGECQSFETAWTRT